MPKQSIVITGGHHNSALVVAIALTKLGYGVNWIGHRHSSRMDHHDSAEYIEVLDSGLPFYDLKAARLTLSPREWFLAPAGILRSILLLRHLKPAAVLSFGGYLGGTVALAAKALGIPIFLHEQTVTAGRANKLIGRLAKRVYLTWAESAKYFDPTKTQVVGLPLRQSILKHDTKHFFTRAKPTLLIMGGKQGAHTLNQFVFQNLPDLLSHYNLIHQTGTSSLTHDYTQALSHKESLLSLSDCYAPIGYITQNQIGQYLGNTDVYLGRSGAHICYELGLLGVPSILVPLMSTHDNEQYKNAKILEHAKLAKIILPDQLTMHQLLQTIDELKKLKFKPLRLPKDATTVLIKDLLSHL